jgi:hypothetical protein
MTQSLSGNWPPRVTAGDGFTDRLARIERRQRIEASRWADTPEIRNHVVKLSTHGPRVLLEFLAEVGLRNRCAADIGKRLSAYSSLTPEVLEAFGGDRLVPRRPLLVPLTEFTEGAE